MSSVALQVMTKFAAVDKLTAVYKNIKRAGVSAGTKIKNAFHAAERADRRLRKSLNNTLGTLGKLGVGIGLATVLGTIARANIEAEASFASLSAITGVTGKDFDIFKDQVRSVATSQKEFTGDTAKAFELIASAQPQLLENAEALAKVTNATITLSKASGDDLALSAENMTSVMNQFNLTAADAERTMNALAAGSVYGSANITNVAASMKKFGAVANAANITMEQSVALVEVMGSKAIFAENAGEMLKSAIINLKNAQLGYQSGVFNMTDALTELKAKVDAARTAKEKDKIVTDVFKKTGITQGQILLDNIELYDRLTKDVTGTSKAVEQMKIKTNTLQAKLKETKNAFLNVVTAENKTNGAMNATKKILGFVADNMETIINVIGFLIAAYTTFRIVSAAATAAQWAMNLSMASNSVGLVVTAIAALIAGLVVLTHKLKQGTEEWRNASNEQRKDMMKSTPLFTGMIVIGELIRKKWAEVGIGFRSIFNTGGFKQFRNLLTLGVLDPIIKIVEFMSQIPIIGGQWAKALPKLRNKMDEISKEATAIINVEAEKEKKKAEEKASKDELQIGIRSSDDLKTDIIKNSGIPVKMSSTTGWACG